MMRVGYLGAGIFIGWVISLVVFAIMTDKD